MDNCILGRAARLTDIVPVLLALMLAACSSSEGGGTGGTGVKSRNIGMVQSTGGALSVDGVAYDTGAAAVTVDKQTANISTLRVGMVVTVDGIVDTSGLTGRADRIEYDHVLEGPIEAIDVVDRGLTVLGQHIAVDLNTQCDGVACSALSLSDVIEVSGFQDAKGVLHATYIKKESGSGTASVDVEGVISSLDTGAETFSINGLTVQYTTASVSGAEALANGQYVEVDGTYTARLMMANQIEVESPASGDMSGERIKVEGYVTIFLSSSEQFEVSGRWVSTTPQTQYEHGTATNLRLNTPLSVEGVIDAAGVLVAHKIEFK